MPPDVNPSFMGPKAYITLEILFKEKNTKVIHKKSVTGSWKGPVEEKGSEA